MPGITLAQAEAKLTTYMDAEDAVLNRNQSYTIGERTLERADLGEIREGIKFWQGEVSRLSTGGGRRVRLATPI